MTAPVFVADRSSLTGAAPGSVVMLGGPEGRHAVSVRRLRIGEQVDLVDGYGRRARGEVAGRDGQSTLLMRVESVEDEPPPSVRIVAVVALIKGDRFDDALTMLTEVGVDEIVPWSAQRCVVQWRGEKSVRGADRAASVVAEAGKQSRRSRFPEIAPLASTPDVVQRVRRAATALVMHETAAQALTASEVARVGEVVLVCGPEGGLTPDEVAAFAAAGARPVRMGPSVQRAATASVAAAVLALAASGRWD